MKKLIGMVNEKTFPIRYCASNKFEQFFQLHKPSRRSMSCLLRYFLAAYSTNPLSIGRDRLLCLAGAGHSGRAGLSKPVLIAGGGACIPLALSLSYLTSGHAIRQLESRTRVSPEKNVYRGASAAATETLNFCPRGFFPQTARPIIKSRQREA